MVSNRCKMAVKEELKKLGLHFILVDLGEVEIMETLTKEELSSLKESLLPSGLELMDDKRAVLIEKIKNVIIQMVHHSDEIIKINFSNFLSEKLKIFRLKNTINPFSHFSILECQSRIRS